MERENNQTKSIFWLVVSLSLKTLYYAVVFGALLTMLIFSLSPVTAEKFYLDLGNRPMALLYMERQINADDSDTGSLIRATNLSLELAREDCAYGQQAERYLEKLLWREGIDARLKEIDAYNISSLTTRQLHPGFYSVKDHYLTELYRLKVAGGKTDLIIDGEYVSISDFLSSDRAGDAELYATVFNQLSQYVSYCSENGKSPDINQAQLVSTYDRVLLAFLSELEVEKPSLKHLFVLRALGNFAGAYRQYAVLGDMPHAGCEDVAELYSLCLTNYCNNN